MFVQELETKKSGLRLVKPDVDRDAPLSVEWLADPHGRETLDLMGVAPRYNIASSLEAERKRVQDFLDKTDGYNWAIEFNGEVVGAIWYSLKPDDELPAGAISFMIGDVVSRGQGVGLAAADAVCDWLDDGERLWIYSRYLTKNNASKKLLERIGFTADGAVYTDADGLEWQNASKQLG